LGCGRFVKSVSGIGAKTLLARAHHFSEAAFTDIREDRGRKVTLAG